MPLRYYLAMIRARRPVATVKLRPGEWDRRAERQGWLPWLAVALVLAVSPPDAPADATPASETIATNEAGHARNYRTPAERREAGARHVVSPWFEVSTLVEWEGSLEDRERETDPVHDRSRSHGAGLQLGMDFIPTQSLKAELLLEWNTETQDLIADEALAIWEPNDQLEWELGKGYTPLGEYLSHFATGPLLEFGETRADMVALNFRPGARIDVSLAAYRGLARREDAQTGEPADGQNNWACALQASPTRTLSVGLAFQSDLADSDARLLAHNDDRYRNEVSGASGFLVWSAQDLEFSIEVLSALRSFDELDPDRDRPRAWNLEFAHFPGPRIEWALRVEGSRELEDAPEHRAGIAFTWRPAKRLSITFDYLHGHFANGLALDENDQAYVNSDRFVALVSLGL